VWVIDSGLRRHVIDPASLASWGFSVTTWTAAKVDAYPQGADWPTTPFLIQGAGDPAIYVLDSTPGTQPVDAGKPGEIIDASVPANRATGPSADDGGFSDASLPTTNAGNGGCAVARGAPSSDSAGPWLALGVVTLLARRSRRRR
jgi:MYXO-CTERM domain-containing protein